MKVTETQKNAGEWKIALNTLNKASNGQVQIAYLDENGKKRVGYLTITDILLKVEEKEITLGNLLVDMLNFNMETLKKVEIIEKGVASKGNDLLIVKEDEQGYIKTITAFNNNVDLVIANQQIPSDFDKGYYYVENGIIELDEKHKLELYPDFI